VLGGGRHGGGDGTGRSPAHVAEAVTLLVELDDQRRVDDAARDPAFHHQITLQRFVAVRAVARLFVCGLYARHVKPPLES
jgi:hypothetical protein